MSEKPNDPLREEERAEASDAPRPRAESSQDGQRATGDAGADVTSGATQPLELDEPDSPARSTLMRDRAGRSFDGDPGATRSGDGAGPPARTPSAERPAGGRATASRGRRRLPRGRTILVALLILLPLGALASVAYATYDYSQEYEGKILPGATIAGTDVGGMNRRQAIRAVRKALRPQMRRKVTVRWRGQRWTVTPAQLGARSDARAAVEAALADSGDVGMVDKAQMRFLGRDLDFQQDVALRYPRKPAFAFIEGLASEFNKEPRDASLDYSSGWVEIVKEKPGRKINVKKSSRALLRALRSGSASTQLDVRTPQPEVTADSFDQVLLLRQSEHKLYFYQDGKITHEYLVATGQPAYPTPTVK